MSEILSQSEIDELLNAMSSGDVLPEQINESKDKQQVKKYDFRSPKKFSKDIINTLEMVNENYARIISGFLSAQIRTNVEVNVAIVDQVTYEEFIRSISNPTILISYKMPPLSGTLLLETSPQFVFQFLDILFGGTGDTLYKAREFTEIEKSVIGDINKKLIDNLKLAWEDVLDVKPEIQSIDTNPAMNQSIAPNEPVAVISLSVKINSIQTYINLCIPYIAVEKLTDRIIVKYWFTGTDSDDKIVMKNAIAKSIQKVPLSITTVLGTAHIPVRNFMDLQVGDVIELERKVVSPLDTFIEGKLHYKVLPGSFNKKKAVQIVEVIDKDVEEHE